MFLLLAEHLSSEITIVSVALLILMCMGKLFYFAI